MADRPRRRRLEWGGRIDREVDRHRHTWKCGRIGGVSDPWLRQHPYAPSAVTDAWDRRRDTASRMATRGRRRVGSDHAGARIHGHCRSLAGGIAQRYDHPGRTHVAASVQRGSRRCDPGVARHRDSCRTGTRNRRPGGQDEEVGLRSAAHATTRRRSRTYGSDDARRRRFPRRRGSRGTEPTFADPGWDVGSA